jgi:hypothetical protein
MVSQTHNGRADLLFPTTPATHSSWVWYGDDAPLQTRLSAHVVMVSNAGKL